MAKFGVSGLARDSEYTSRMIWDWRAGVPLRSGFERGYFVNAIGRSAYIS